VSLVALTILLTAPQLAAREASAKRSPNAYNFRRLADAYVAAGKYAQASEAFARASALYGKAGDPNAAKVLDLSARRYRTEIRLFAEVPTTPGDARANWTGMRLEPLTGCYLGANIEREDATRDYQAFNHLVGRHAVFFMYRRYGVRFPNDQVRALRNARAALQIAFEPRSLTEVRDDAYLRQFAEDARRSGIPIFLRFASEMNGDWVAYGRDPAAYRAAFRLVSRVVRGIAPNVAMVWCPNETPERSIPSYYPGADAVDWVGVNFYSVLYNDGNRARAAEWKHPIDAIDFVYRTYARRHPMMIGEWAATHRSVLDDRNRPEFARTKIGQFYAALPRLYPRLKAVHWLSMNTLNHSRPDRQLNNFSLLDEPSVAGKYRTVTSSPYYLTEVVDGTQASPTRFVPLRSGMTIRPGTRVSAFVRSYETNPTVRVVVDGRPALQTSESGPYEVALPNRAGTSRITYEVRDQAGHVAGRSEVKAFLN
jgi:hypothetical protein